MYKLPYFTEEDEEKVMAFIKENSFAIITGSGDEYPVATHVPLDIKQQENKIIFTGHMMKNTDHQKAFVKNENVLVIFNGPHCYVSAGWYSNPVQASTWNYMTVHAKGKIHFKNEERTKDIVHAITNKYEGSGNASSFNNLSNEYVDRLVKAIIGFTIEVEIIDNVFKLSQNHEQDTRQSIIKHLNENGSDNEMRIAKEMHNRI
ncbi:MAG: FMN-binding negative transcriptional regulator [Ginsengibacter sp.]